MSSEKHDSLKRNPRYYTGVLFLGAAFILLILLPLFQKGTFIDGQLYKTVAFNEAIGSASFWHMKYTNTCMAFFCEQPPLYPALLGWSYVCFGAPAWLADRLFTLLLCMLFMALMYGITKRLFANARFYYLLFVFMMLSVPVWCWSYVNQVIEPLVCVFIAAGVLCFLLYRSSQRLLHVFLFAMVLYLSFLAKGFQSCFLVVLPVAYFLWNRLPRSVLYLALGSGILFAAGLFITLACYKPAADWFACYYTARLVLTMQNVGQTTNSHLEIIVRFFTELIIPVLLLAGVCVYLNWKKKYPLRFVLKNFAAGPLAMPLLITAVAGSFPYALSLVQRGFYLVPSFVCFVLAILIGFKRYWLFLHAGMQSLGRRNFIRMAVVLIFAGSMCYAAFTIGDYKRDKDLLTDIETMAPYFKQGDTVLIENSLWNYFSLHSYLYMQKQVSLSIDKTNSRFMICNKTCSFDTAAAFTRLNITTRQLGLFVRKK